MIEKILYKLFRFKPTIAWSVCGILLGISVAINEHGTDLNWLYLVLVVIPIVAIQGLIAHAVNDLEDEEVDRKTDIKGTNRFKVLVSGMASRKHLEFISLILIGVTAAVAVNLFIILGFPILVFYSIALYAALGYSLPPLKLGWKPYAEWTVVLPVLVTLVVAVNYIATGKLSYLAFIIGILFALFNITWFLVSRMMDYQPDKESGKITTFVKIGLDYKPSFYFDWIHPYLATLIILLFWFAAYVLIFVNNLVGLSSIIMWFYILRFVPRHCDLNPVLISISRTYLIVISIINSIAISLILIFIK